MRGHAGVGTLHHGGNVCGMHQEVSGLFRFDENSAFPLFRAGSSALIVPVLRPVHFGAFSPIHAMTATISGGFRGRRSAAGSVLARGIVRENNLKQ